MLVETQEGKAEFIYRGLEAEGSDNEFCWESWEGEETASERKVRLSVWYMTAEGNFDEKNRERTIKLWTQLLFLMCRGEETLKP